jgi:hypothetical protein
VDDRRGVSERRAQAFRVIICDPSHAADPARKRLELAGCALGSNGGDKSDWRCPFGRRPQNGLPDRAIGAGNDDLHLALLPAIGSTSRAVQL